MTFPPRCAALFRAGAELARGGYGTVYRAEQVALARPVVVKLLSAAGQADAEQRARFAAEARITASLAHPHIVVVIDHDVSESPPWLAMEELPGPDVRHLIEAGAVPPAEAARIGAQVASALDAAHAREVLHRDVKPENVLAAGPRHYKVTDFGIAKWSGTGITTADGMILGTPAYLSPEVCSGHAARPASDVYALGVMLFELFTGQRPFERAAVMDLLTAHARETPSRATALAPELAPEIDALIARMLSKSPVERPRLAEVVAALEPFHGDGPLAAAPRANASGRRARPVQATVQRAARASGATARPGALVAPPPPASGTRPRALGAVMGAVALAAVAAAALRAPPRPGPERDPAASVATPAPSASAASARATPAPARLTDEQLDALRPTQPGNHDKAYWQTHRGNPLSDWYLAEHAIDFELDVKKAENLVGGRNPRALKGQPAETMADLEIFAIEMRLRRWAQNRSDGRPAPHEQVRAMLDELEALAGDPVHARSGRYHALRGEHRSFLGRPPGERALDFARAMGLVPLPDGSPVQPKLITTVTLHLLGDLGLTNTSLLSEKQAVVLLGKGWQTHPENPNFSANYARALAITDPKRAEHVLRKCNPPVVPGFWWYHAWERMAQLRGLLGLALRTLVHLRATITQPNEREVLESFEAALPSEVVAPISQLEVDERRVDLEAAWGDPVIQGPILAVLGDLAAKDPVIAAGLMAHGHRPFDAARAPALIAAAVAAGALRSAYLLEARRTPGLTAAAYLARQEEPPVHHALRYELDGREAVDTWTRALAHHMVLRVAAQVEPLYQRLLASGVTEPLVVAEAGFAAHHRGLTDRALALTERAVRAAPSEVMVVAARTRVLCELRRYREALDVAAPVRQRGPLPVPLIADLAQAETMAGDAAEALALTDAALKDVKDAWVLQFRRGEALLALGRFDEAAVAFRAGAALPGGKPSGLEGQARALARRHDDVAAEAAFQESLEAGAEPWIRESYASFLESHNRSDDAKTQRRLARKAAEAGRR